MQNEANNSLRFQHRIALESRSLCRDSHKSVLCSNVQFVPSF